MKFLPASNVSRPWRLSRAEADEAHREPWDETAIARFTGRIVALIRRGLAPTDSDDVAERLHLRDVRADDQRSCIECVHLAGSARAGWRCGNHRAASVGRELPADWPMRLQRCPGFDVQVLNR